MKYCQFKLIKLNNLNCTALKFIQYKLEMENVCRTCLRIPIESTDLYKNANLINKIENIASLKLVIKAEYPSIVCEDCITSINKFYNFRKVIINTDRDIKERLETLKKLNNIAKPRSSERKTRNVNKKKDNINKLATTEEDTGHISDNNNDILLDNDPITDTNSDSSYDSDFKETNGNISEQNEIIQRALATCKIWKCKTCKTVFDTRYKLKVHKRTDHIAKGMCSICGLVVRKDNLKRHIRMHSETPLKCEHCGRVCKNSESLRTHKLQHRGFSYTCEVCGKTFTTKSLHTSHMKCHVDPDKRKTACQLCGKKVNRILRHMVSHTGERPYVCNFCNKGFTSPTALKVHIRQHTNEKPYICVYCPSAFTQNVSLKTHLKSKHGTAN